MVDQHIVFAIVLTLFPIFVALGISVGWKDTIIGFLGAAAIVSWVSFIAWLFIKP